MTFSTFFHQSATPPFSLPNELALQIAQDLKKPALLAFSQTNRYCFSLANDNAIWRQHYGRDFGHIPFKDDAKNQYIAAYLFQQAEDARPDIAQVYFRAFYQFLASHPFKPWTAYYLGIMQFYGKGCLPKPKNGFRLLMEAMDLNDHRAVFAILTIFKNFKLLTKKTLLSLLGTKKMNKLILQLENQGNQRKAEAHYWLGWLYSHGLGVEIDFDTAEHYYLLAMKAHHLPAIKAFIHCKCRQISSFLLESDHRRAINQLINKLDDLAAEYADNPAFLAELFFRIGWLHSNNNNFLECLDYDLMAIELNHIQAKIEIGIYYSIVGNRVAEALTLFHEAALGGSAEASQKWFSWLLLQNPLNFCIDEIRKISPKALSYIARNVAQQYSSNSPHELARHPAQIWWLQFAAQCGYSQSLSLLKRVKSPFADCALGILYEYGILHSADLKPSHDLAVNYFDQAQRRDSNAIKRYLQAGIDEGLCGEQTKLLLERHQRLCPRMRSKTL